MSGGTIKAVPDTRLAAAKAAADKAREEIRSEAYAEGVKVGERHKAMMFALAGFVIGALCMGLYSAAMQERAAFNAGAIIDRVLSRTVEPPALPAGPAETLSEQYVRNTQAAREQACRQGIRDPRTGLCPREPGSVPDVRR